MLGLGVAEKRFNPRRETSRNILVVARFADQRVTGRLINVSVGGGCAFKFDQPFQVVEGTRFEVTFCIPVKNVYKIHFKHAIVIHVTNGIIGVITGPRERKLITDQIG
jgi:hypothetical protein